MNYPNVLSRESAIHERRQEDQDSAAVKPGVDVAHGLAHAGKVALQAMESSLGLMEGGYLGTGRNLILPAHQAYHFGLAGGYRGRIAPGFAVSGA
jgi:hypothetical protein